MEFKRHIKLFTLIILTAVIMGCASAIFLQSLEYVTNFRMSHYQLFYLIPVIGVATAFIYNNYGKGSQRGNNLIIESTHKETKVPLRMAFLTFIFTVLTHLVGGSAGREGTAVQIGGTVTNKLANIFKLEGKDKKTLIMVGISSAFGSVFGTPLAGTFFGVEVCFIGKLSYESIFPCFIGAYVADYVTSFFGIKHSIHSIISVPNITIYTLVITIISACIFGIVGKLFSRSIKFLKKMYSSKIKNYLLRALISSFIVLIIIVIFNFYEYGGLSTWLIDAGFNGTSSIGDSIKKFILTVLTLASGFQGGEVTPLFDIGASLGGAIGQIAHIEPSLLAALGLICVFGSATNTPIATIMLGIEMFGDRAIPYYIISVLISYYIGEHNSIYGAQVIETPKKSKYLKDKGYSIEEILK